MIEWIATLLLFSAPVAYAALGESVSERAGVLNIGIEGTMLTSAYFAASVAIDSGSVFLGFGAGLLAAIAITLLQALLVLRWAADQVVVGVGINLAALGLTSTLFRSKYGSSGQLLSTPALSRWEGFDPVTILLPILAVAIAFAVSRSGWGLAVRAAGEYPEAVEAAGKNPLRLRLQALVIGGLLIGLGGAYLALGTAGSFAENMTGGRGFVAIAMVTFGRWKPVWSVTGALFVGWLESLQYGFQADNATVPFQVFVAMPYIVALSVLVIAGRGTAMPAALALPYRRKH